MADQDAARLERDESAAVPALRSGPIEVRPATRELLIDGQTVAIERRAFDLLVYLMRRADRVVDKDELWREVWQSRPVSESTLPQAVSRVRRVLGGSDSEACVATVYGVGYRFVLPVETVPAALPSSTTTQREPADNVGAASESPLRWPSAAFLLLMLALVVLAVWKPWRAGPAEGAVRVALLPVQIDGADAELEWVRYGVLPLFDRSLAEAGVISVDAAAVLATLRRYPETTDDEGQARLLRLNTGANRVVVPHLSRDAEGFRMKFRDVADPDGRWMLSLAGADVSVLAVAAGDRLSRSLSESLDRWQGAQRARRSLVTDDPFVNEAFVRGLDARLRGRFEEAVRFFETVLAAAPDLHEAKYHLSLVTRRLGRWDETERLHRELLAAAQEQGDIEMLAAVQSVSGTLAWRLGDPHSARQWYQESLANYRAQGNADYVASVTSNLGILAATQADYPEAESHFRAALAHYRQAGDRYNEATALKNLGNLASDQGRFEEAETVLLEALAIRQELELPLEVALTISVLADLAMARGRWTDALAHQERVIAAAQEHQSPLLEAQGHADLAAALRRLGRLQDARVAAARAHAVATALGNPASEAMAVQQQGHAEHDLGNFVRAGELYSQAASVYERIEQPLGRGHSLLALAASELAADRVDAAEAALASVVAITTSTPIPRLDAGIARARAEMAAARDDHVTAVAEMTRAYDLAKSGETVIEALDIGGRLGSLIINSMPGDDRLAKLAEELSDGAHASIEALAFLSRYQERRDPALALDLAERRRRLAGEGWRAKDEAELEALRRVVEAGKGRRPSGKGPGKGTEKADG